MHTQVTLLGNADIGVWRKYWASFVHRVPYQYEIFIGDRSARTGETMDEMEARNSCCPAMLPMILLWPFWLLWFLLAFLIVTPIIYCARAPEVRFFEVQGGEHGHYTLVQMDGVGSGERAPLLHHT